MHALRAFHEELIDVYGFYMQVTIALINWRSFLTKTVSSPTTSLQNRMFFGETDPNRTDATYRYVQSYAELLAAAQPDGITTVITRRTAIVFAYALWEDRYRSEIAAECSVSKNQLQSDVFRDLNKYRQAILHAGNTLCDEPKVLRFFDKGDKLNLSNEHMTDIFRALVDELNRIAEVYYNASSQFDFEKALNSPSHPKDTN